MARGESRRTVRGLLSVAPEQGRGQRKRHCGQSETENIDERLLFTGQPDYTSRMQRLTLPIIVEGDGDGYFVTCPALQGCYSQGDTYEEAIANIKDAIRLHIEDRMAEGEEIAQPDSVSLSTIEIAV